MGEPQFQRDFLSPEIVLSVALCSPDKPVPGVRDQFA